MGNCCRRREAAQNSQEHEKNSDEKNSDEKNSDEEHHENHENAQDQRCTMIKEKGFVVDNFLSRKFPLCIVRIVREYIGLTAYFTMDYKTNVSCICSRSQRILVGLQNGKIFELN